MPYNCTRFWPSPKTFPFIDAVVTGNFRHVSFEASTTTSNLSFLQDVRMKGQSATHFSAWLEMLQEASSVLLARSTTDISILVENVLGTTKPIEQTEHNILCTIDTISGFASISAASGSHLSAKIMKCTGGLSHVKKTVVRLGSFIEMLEWAPMFTNVSLSGESIFAEAIVARDALDFITHPGLIQSSLALHHLALIADRYCATVSFVSCASIAIQDTCNNLCELGNPSKATLCEHSCQNLKCTNVHGQAFLQFTGLQMGSWHGSSMGTPDLPTYALVWHPLAMAVSTQRSSMYTTPLRWIILSNMPRNIQDLCCKMDQSVMATTVVLCGPGSQRPSEIHLSDEQDLLYFLSTVKADNCLVVQRFDEIDCHIAKSSAESAMLWVWRAYARAPTSFKMNLVTTRQCKGYMHPEVSLCQGRESNGTLVC